MKKFNLSLAAFLAMGTFAMAGGDIAPVEPVVEAPVVVEEPSTGAFYVGIAYSAANYDETMSYTLTGVTDLPQTGSVSGDEDYSAVMLQAGYKFNPYIAVEGRYWFGLEEDVGDNTDLTVDTWGIYVKPMYPVTEAFDIYALLGYADSDVELSGGGTTVSPPYDMDGFSWGIGGAYSFTENLAVFVDYTSLYDDDNTVTYDVGTANFDEEITSWNFGVTYTF
ncbi:MAG TPA: porin family protein [Sulfurovum sp.]|uniref:outer membrane protein n=1 Tax=Sulfurovum sp. TaxID=1969726 RepID=UPI002F95C89D